MMENNYFFKKLTSKHTEEKERVLVIILLQETKNSNLYNKNYAQNVKTITSKPKRQITYST